MTKNVPRMLCGCRACTKPSVYWLTSLSSNDSVTTTVNAIACVLTCSALPARSVEKNLTVVFFLTVNEPVYTVLDVVGVDPSVV